EQALGPGASELREEQRRRGESNVRAYSGQGEGGGHGGFLSRLADGGPHARLRLRGVAGDQFFECSKRTLTCFLVPQQAAMVVAGEDDAEHLEADLLGVGARIQVAFL